MKFTADRTMFAKEVSKFLPFVERKTTIPILSNLLIVADVDRLTITATDLDVSLVSQFHANVDAVGSITVPARKLADTLKKMSTLEDTVITIEVVDNWVNLSCGEFSTKIVGMASLNYPSLPVQPKDGVEIRADILDTLIRKTRFAIAQKELRYTLNAALFIVKPESVAMVTTDGRRLAHVECNSGHYAVDSAEETLIAVAGLDRLLPFLGKGMGLPVRFSKNAEGVLFFHVHPEYTVIVRPLTGKFPNWQAVMPKNNTITLTLDDKLFTAALGRVSQFADGRSMACKMELVPNSGLIISAASSEQGSASELIKVPCVEDSLTIGMDARYVLDILKAMGEPVIMKLRDSQFSVLFGPATESEYKFQVVQMPVRL